MGADSMRSREQLQASQHLARTTHERLEQLGLLRRENYLGVAAPRAARRRVETQLTDFEHGRPLDGTPAGQCAKPCQQLGEREGLRQVVVGAGVEPRDAIFDCVACREQKHRRPDPRVPQPTAGLEPADRWEHDVQHDRVVGVSPSHPERVLARPGDVGRVSLLDQSAPDTSRHLELVLDDQHAHGAIVARG